MTMLDVTLIRTDGGTQPREAIDLELAAEYADAMKRGDLLPPISVTYDGEHYWLTDGFHRLDAAKAIGRERITAQVLQGTKRDAQWRSLAANSKHGKRRSRADLQRAIRRVLLDEEWCKKSDSAIARHLGCTDKTVGKYRAEMELTSEIPKSAERIGADGRSINTAKIGRPSSAEGGSTSEIPKSDKTSEGAGEPSSKGLSQPAKSKKGTRQERALQTPEAKTKAGNPLADDARLVTLPSLMCAMLDVERGDLEYLDALYKRAARLAHPDHGGSGELFALLNKLHTRQKLRNTPRTISMQGRR